MLKNSMAEKGLDLVDIKYEFGEIDGQTIIIDEISGDGMRVVKDGRVLLQKELAAALPGASCCPVADSEALCCSVGSSKHVVAQRRAASALLLRGAAANCALPAPWRASALLLCGEQQRVVALRRRWRVVVP